MAYRRKTRKNCAKNWKRNHTAGKKKTFHSRFPLVSLPHETINHIGEKSFPLASPSTVTIDRTPQDKSVWDVKFIGFEIFIDGILIDRLFKNVEPRRAEERRRRASARVSDAEVDTGRPLMGQSNDLFIFSSPKQSISHALRFASSDAFKNA